MLKNQKITYAVLITLWCAGLLLGIVLSMFDLSLYGELMCVVLTRRPTFVALLLRNCLPIVLLYVIFLRSLFFVTYPFVFFDALCRGFCAMCIVSFFGSGAWLLRIMVLFSTGCVSILVWYMLFSYLHKKGRCTIPNMIAVFLIPVVTTIVDYFCVSPYLLSLSKYF